MLLLKLLLGLIRFLLGAALFQPGHPLFAAGGRTVVSGPGAAAFTAFAAGGAVCVFTVFSVYFLLLIDLCNGLFLAHYSESNLMPL